MMINGIFWSKFLLQFNYISFLIEYFADTIPVPLILHELIKKIQGAFYYIGLTTYRKKKGSEYTVLELVTQLRLM